MTIQIPTQGSLAIPVKTYKITLVLCATLGGCQPHFLLREPFKSLRQLLLLQKKYNFNLGFPCFNALYMRKVTGEAQQVCSISLAFSLFSLYQNFQSLSVYIKCRMNINEGRLSESWRLLIDDAVGRTEIAEANSLDFIF